jgi:hemerythrin superfamily protein
LMDEADMQHAEAKNLIALLMDVTNADEGRYEATVIMLAEIIDHHIEEEEGEMFPKVKKANIDIAELGEALDQSREELQGEMDEAVPPKVGKAHAR